jgi:hypothetical protein
MSNAKTIKKTCTFFLLPNRSWIKRMSPVDMSKAGVLANPNSAMKMAPCIGEAVTTEAAKAVYTKPQGSHALSIPMITAMLELPFCHHCIYRCRMRCIQLANALGTMRHLVGHAIEAIMVVPAIIAIHC